MFNQNKLSDEEVNLYLWGSILESFWYYIGFWFFWGCAGLGCCRENVSATINIDVFLPSPAQAPAQLIRLSYFYFCFIQHPPARQHRIVVKQLEISYFISSIQPILQDDLNFMANGDHLNDLDMEDDLNFCLSNWKTTSI